MVEHLAEDRRLHIITVRCDRELIAIAPLALRPRRLRRLLPFPVWNSGYGQRGSDYLDILIRRGREQQALPAIAGCLADRKLMLELSHVRERPHSIDLALKLKQYGWFLPHHDEFLSLYQFVGHCWSPI